MPRKIYPNIKRSVKISGHATSVTIEEPFWNEIKDIATTKGMSLNALISEIDEDFEGNLSSAIRIYVLYHIKGQ